MATVGVALVNGVRRSGYLFAPGFVGDGSLLTDVNTSNVTCARTGQLAYYTDPTTIGGDPSQVVINGDLYVSGNTYTSNNFIYENPILSIGSGSNVFTKGLLISNVLMSVTENILTFGFTNGTPKDVQLFPNLDQNLQVDILGNISAKNFFGNATNLSNIFDSPEGTYGTGLTIPQLVIGPTGRPSINVVTIQSNLETVTSVGAVTSKSIQFENENISLMTNGKVGIANSNPTSLLCVGDGVTFTDKDVFLKGDVTAKNFFGNGSSLSHTTDVQLGQYGDSLNTVQITIDKTGRLSKIDQVPIRSTLDSVMRNGSTSKSTIQLEYAGVSMTTTGKVGIGNKEPGSLLCVGPTTRFDESDLFMSGNVSAQNFFGNAFQLVNTTDVKPGIYGGGAIVPQIWVNDKGRISDIQLTQLFTTLEQVTQFNSSTASTIHLRNKGTGLVSDGDICIGNSKNLVLLDEFQNPVCKFGQESESIHMTGTSQLNISKWQKVSINEGFSVDARGLTSMRGCFMESGTGSIINAQQLSRANQEVFLGPTDIFKWFPISSQTVRLPDPTACVAGSWIGFTNISQSTNIQIFDIFGTTLYATIQKSEFAGGDSKRLLCVSSLAPANGTICADMWIVA